MEASCLYYLHALSPVHMGIGSAVGAIDLPHSREVSTGLPNAPGSGLKGVLRDSLRSTVANHSVLFGAERGQQDGRDQGALLFSDALLLCLAVKSFAGTFAWVTSPLALARFGRERAAMGQQHPGIPEPRTDQPEMPGNVQDDWACVTRGSRLTLQNTLYLHDITLKVLDDSQTCVDAWSALIGSEVFPSREDAPFLQLFKNRFVVVSDNALAYLGDVSMDIRTRNALDKNKMVRDGAVWTEENLPSETILWGTLAAETIQTTEHKVHRADDSLKAFARSCGELKKIQIGGKASVGRGVTRFVLRTQIGNE